MLIHWIWLSRRDGLSDWEKAKLLQHYGDPEDIYCAAPEELGEVLTLTTEAGKTLADKDLRGAQAIVETCSRERIHILTLRDAAYPYRLKHIADPPPVLYYKGTLPDFDNTAVIGIVGTRKASAYGLQTARRMGHQIAACGGLVVSGLAAGVDAMAMTGALEAQCSVVGVLGCGVDIVYPKSNRELFVSAVRYGCIISEFAPGTPAYRWNFPRRNRIISGLSSGVLVVEAPEKSGALITARQASDQGRDVFAVPGNIDNPACAGSNQLLRSGAIPVSSGWDVLSEYESLYPEKLQKRDLPRPPEKSVQSLPEQEKKPGQAAEKENLKNKNDKKVIDKEPSGPYSDVNDILPQLSEEERRIVTALTDGQRLVDDLIAETGLTTGKVLALLTMLELKKVIVRLPGKRITLKL